jgi:nucleoside-diphosphate-sugar epimerase
MRVFITGSTGWVGSAIVKDLIAAGHHVLGLTRSDKWAEALRAAGAEIHRGSLADLDSLRSGAAQSDAVVHTAFNHDFSKFAENCAEDQHAIEALGAVLKGSDRPLLVTSGVALLAPGRTATEADMPPKSSPFPANPRRRRPRWWKAAYGHRPFGSPRRSMGTAITASTLRHRAHAPAHSSNGSLNSLGSSPISITRLISRRCAGVDVRWR